MERDMELIRKILFTIEEEYKPGDMKLFGLQIEGYDMQTIAEHCDLLYQSGLINSYEPTVGGDSILAFRIGNISNRGYDYLELIRNEEIWEKTKNEVEQKKLPKSIEFIARIAGIFTGNVINEISS